MNNPNVLCGIVGGIGYGLTRIPGFLFPEDIEKEKIKAELAKSPASVLEKVQQIVNRIHLVRNDVRIKLTSWNASNKTWHFLSTSVKDNLGFVLFFLCLIGKNLDFSERTENRIISNHPNQELQDNSALSQTLDRTSLQEMPPAHQDISITHTQRVVASSHLVRQCFHFLRTRNPDALLTLGAFVVLSCTVAHLGRAAIFIFGNRVLNKIEQRRLTGATYSAILVTRWVFTRIAPSDLA